MEPTVRSGKSKFFSYVGMGKSLAHDAVVGLCIHSRDPNALTHMATVLGYFFNNPVSIIVHDRVNPDAKIPFRSCMELFRLAFINAKLPPPVEFNAAFVADFELGTPILRDCELKDERGLTPWVAHGVHKTRQALFPQDLNRSWQ